MQPKVSVIVPCYNQALYLEEALNSVLAQTFTDWECIIVNDGSKDNTTEIAQKFCTADKRFLLVIKNNGGLASARNAGLQKATGDYIQFLDADDIIFPDKFQMQVDALIDAGAQLSICDYAIKTIHSDKVTEQNETIQMLHPESSLLDIIGRWQNGLSIPCHSILISRSFLQENNIHFNEALINHEDWAFWVEVFACKPNYIKVNKILCFYMRRGFTMSSDKYLMRKGFLSAISYLEKKFEGKNVDELFQSLLSEKRQFVLKKYKAHQPFSPERIRKKMKYLQYFLSGKIPVSAFKQTK